VIQGSGKPCPDKNNNISPKENIATFFGVQVASRQRGVR
jgi:hypothetical protein